jgi:hypothetical protein
MNLFLNKFELFLSTMQLLRPQIGSQGLARKRPGANGAMNAPRMACQVYFEIIQGAAGRVVGSCEFKRSLGRRCSAPTAMHSA